MENIIENSKMIFIVCDVNDTDYVTYSFPYTDELINKLDNISKLKKAELKKFLYNLVLYPISDMYPNMIVKYFVANILKVKNINFEI